MKSTRFIAALGFVLMAAPAFAQADKVVAKVDGIPITQQEVELATEDLGERLAQLPEDRKRDEVINYLVDLKLGPRRRPRPRSPIRPISRRALPITARRCCSISTSPASARRP